MTPVQLIAVVYSLGIVTGMILAYGIAVASVKNKLNKWWILFDKGGIEMKLYTCEAGYDLNHKYDCTFGAWSDDEKDHFMNDNEIYYEFEINEESLDSEGTGDYPYYIKEDVNIKFKRVEQNNK